MTERKVLLVGSMPFEDEPTAMATALERVGDHLWALPDGEIGERTEACPGGTRSAWVQTINDRCEADTDNWTVVRPARRNTGGYAADYESGPRLKPKHRPSEMVDHLDFGWAAAARNSYPEFLRLRRQFGLDDLRFQVGLPTGLGATFGMMSPPTALRYSGAFNRRMAREANEILSFTEPGDVIFQVEVPGELALAHRLPKPLVGLATRSVVGLVNQIDVGAPIGIHLCFGDLNNEALIKPSSLDKAVHFANSLIDKWPESHDLAYIHFPLAEAVEPPPLERSHYEPLGRLRIPDGTRFIAGFVHPRRSDEELLTIRSHIEEIGGHEVDIASSCGLGRIDEPAALQVIEAAGQLTN
jgi:hypothetical protein